MLTTILIVWILSGIINWWIFVRYVYQSITVADIVIALPGFILFGIVGVIIQLGVYISENI